ncbi:class I SAM-dependent methyltransferase [Oryzihumus leptocrescens]|uniref:Methyltransferase family protein n=1 Tax=Oryzihumus leptocrescens TaxID=297536 RepID=A0A542ZID7_9MICO|nr:methyltransferase family protein [Oryzihumus leptocrescens]
MDEPRHPELLGIGAFPAEQHGVVQVGARLNGRVLEVGAGTGRATLPLVRGGARVEVVEPSKDMLRILASRLEPEGLRSQCDLRQATFENVDSAQTYDLIIAAKSFHWADPATRWPRFTSLHRTDGRAYLSWNGWHLAPRAHDVDAVRALYTDCGHGLQPDLEDHRADVSWAESEIEAEPALGLVDARTYEWPWRLPVENFLALLMTTSQYSVTAAGLCEPLLDSLRELLGHQVTSTERRAFCKSPPPTRSPAPQRGGADPSADERAHRTNAAPRQFRTSFFAARADTAATAVSRSEGRRRRAPAEAGSGSCQ